MRWAGSPAASAGSRREGAEQPRTCGNCGGRRDDYPYVDCETCREAASARLDGEEPGAETAEIDDHLDACTDCRNWLAEATRVTRALRMGRVDDVPDLSGSVLARVPRGRRRGGGTETHARIGLAAVAAGQWVTGFAVIFGQPVGAALPVHGAHEMGAFNLAVAAGFAWTAWRPREARAQLPLLATLVGVLVVLTVRDLVAGHAAAVAETGHLLLAAGLALTAVLARRFPAPPLLPAIGGGAPVPEAPRSGGADADGARAHSRRPRAVRAAPVRAATAEPRRGRETA